MDETTTKWEYLEQIRENYEERRSRKWWVWYPGEVYANDVDFTYPATLEDAVDYVLNWLGQDEMPAGIKFWMD